AAPAIVAIVRPCGWRVRHGLPAISRSVQSLTSDLVRAAGKLLAALDGSALLERGAGRLAADLEIALALHGTLDVGAGHGLLELGELPGLELDLAVGRAADDRPGAEAVAGRADPRGRSGRVRIAGLRPAVEAPEQPVARDVIDAADQLGARPAVVGQRPALQQAALVELVAQDLVAQALGVDDRVADQLVAELVVALARLARSRLAAAALGLADPGDRTGAGLAAQVLAGAIADRRDRGQPWSRRRRADAAPKGRARIEVQAVAQRQRRALIG